jgi:Acyclic terpene utilisation family protein AtuA
MAERNALRIANCSGFYGDRLSAAREMVEGGPIDVLTGDYLAELTLFLLWRARQKDPAGGYATTFLKQMEEVLGAALARGIKVVSNAGGLNPAGLAEALRQLCGRLGLSARVAHVEGDDVLDRLEGWRAQGQALAHMDTGRPLSDAGLRAVTANAYLGGWGIAAALHAGADVVVCGRVADAALVTGPAAWRFGWARDDWDRLAGAAVAGHVLECGAQATGGNYAFFEEVPGLERPGFPLAEVHEDGSFVVTKHPGTGGLVSVGTVTAQLVYEIEGPRYATPDVVARFDTIRLEQEGPDRVRVHGVRGEPAPAHAKVAINLLGGYRNGMTLVLSGLDIDAKAALVERTLRARLAGVSELEVALLRAGPQEGDGSAEANALLRVTVKDPDARRAGRAFSAAVVEMALASYPGFQALAPPGDESPYAVFWPALVPAGLVTQTVVLDGGRIAVTAPAVPAPGRTEDPLAPAAAPPAGGPRRRIPLGRLFGARSGDKGGNANVGVWARTDAAYAWLQSELTTERFRQLVPETAGLEVRRYALPNLRALNFVVAGLLGDGALSSTRLDPQAKGLGESLRARMVEVPEVLLAPDGPCRKHPLR